MPLTRTVLVSTPVLGIKAVEEVGTVWQDRPFKLQVGNVNVRLNYEELSKIISDAEGEIRDLLDYEDTLYGEEHV